MSKKVIVIGAGAGGMMAAGHAAELGAEVILLEKTDHPGKKILISGNGRCNISHNRPLESFIAQYGINGRFLYSAFSRFFREELQQFLRRYGVETITKPEGKIYPASQNAREVVRAFEAYLADHKVTLLLNTGVNHINVENGVVVSVRTLTTIYPCDAVILATGGSSHPQTGSTGDGYRMAAELGHKIVKIRPGLVPLKVKEAALAKNMMGASLQSVRATAFQCAAGEISTGLIPPQDTGMGISGKKPKLPVIESRTGDAIITHFGLSGPIILEMSLAIVDALAKGPVSVNIDLKPEISELQLRSLLQQEFNLHSKREYQTILKSFLTSKVLDTFVILSGIDAAKPASQINASERDRIAALMKSLRFNIEGPFSMATAMVTAGGVSLDEIDPKTMASKIISGLYFCGEVMDIDAGTGGYNLQAAFSTGYVAGESAAS
ncbi:MAG: NAD(P)/FAD-dependent oxidoreductase [Dehalococcoidales bacterium]|nr:NAD(P)/FAD-dependent oxidoreductase [Dehalococcoidales bacterium]